MLIYPLTRRTPSISCLSPALYLPRLPLSDPQCNACIICLVAPRYAAVIPRQQEKESMALVSDDMHGKIVPRSCLDSLCFDVPPKIQRLSTSARRWCPTIVVCASTSICASTCRPRPYFPIGSPCVLSNLGDDAMLLQSRSGSVQLLLEVHDGRIPRAAHCAHIMRAPRALDARRHLPGHA